MPGAINKAMQQPGLSGIKSVSEATFLCYDWNRKAC